MLYYVNINKKRVVGRNNQQSTRPITLEYDVTEVIDFQFIDDNNQLQPLSPNTPGLTLAIGLKQNMPSYDLLALSHDYEIINGQTLRFTVNTYTVNWLKKINKPNTEVFIEISQQSLESKKVWMRDYCYVWPRVYTAGLEPEEIESNDYYTKVETDEAIENAIEGIGISGYVTTEEFEEGLSTKQNTITDENKLGFTLLSGVPNYVSGLTLNGNPVEVVDGVVGIPRTSQNDWGVVRVNPGVGIGADSGQIYTIRAENAEIAARTQNFKPIVPSNLNEAVKAALTDANHVTLTDAEKTTAQTVLGVDAAVSGYATETFVENAVSGKQDAITVDNKLDYALLSGTPEVPTVEWGAISGTLSNQTDLQNALNGKANASDIPLSTSQLTNDSGFVTSSVMEDALSGKQDLIDDMNWLPATYVRMDIDHWQGDPDFDVAAAVNMTRDDVYAVSGALSGKQDAITNDNKLDYALLSGTPSIPLSTSELVNDSDFQTSTDVANAISGKLDAPSGGFVGQVLTKTDNGEKWADTYGSISKIDEKTTSGAFIIDFTSAPIQKYDMASAPTGSVTFDYANLSGIADNQASTIEIQMPIETTISTVVFPSNTQIIEMPEELKASEISGAYAYHDIVFRKQGRKVYANHAYKYDEKPDYFWIECRSSTAAIYIDDSNWRTGGEYDLHLECSFDGGETWEPWSDLYADLEQGDKMLLRSTQVNTAMNTGEGNFLRFASDSSNDRFNIGGDIMTLVDGTGKTTEIPTNNYFNHFFYQFNVVDASEFKFTSAKKLKYRCFGNMFRDCIYLTAAPKVIGRNVVEYAEQCYQAVFNGCTGLTKAPVIETLSIGAAVRPFQGLFINCTNLNEITTYFSDWGNNGQGCYLWASGVSSVGTFKCPVALSTSTRDASHVPAGWTIVNI